MSKVVQIVGHRGSGYETIPNSMISFYRAVELCLDYVEFDVWLTSDGVPVIIHDNDVSVTTNGTGYIEQMTFYDVSNLKLRDDSHVPSLEKIIKLLKPTNVGLHIELKGLNTVKFVLKLLLDHNITNRVIISSFHHKLIKEINSFRTRESPRSRADRRSPRTALSYTEAPGDFVHTIKEYGAVQIDVCNEYLNEQLVNTAHKNGFTVMCWYNYTYSETKDDLEYAISLGVDAICTNHPKLLLDIINCH